MILKNKLLFFIINLSRVAFHKQETPETKVRHCTTSPLSFLQNQIHTNKIIEQLPFIICLLELIKHSAYYLSASILWYLYLTISKVKQIHCMVVNVALQITNKKDPIGAKTGKVSVAQHAQNRNFHVRYCPLIVKSQAVRIGKHATQTNRTLLIEDFPETGKQLCTSSYT
jgi:hypothetical protein